MTRVAALLFCLLTVPSIAQAGRFVGLLHNGCQFSGTVISIDRRLYVLTTAHGIDDQSVDAQVFPGGQNRFNTRPGKVVAIDYARDLAIVEYNHVWRKNELPTRLADSCPTDLHMQVRLVGYGKGRFNEHTTQLKEPVYTAIRYKTHTAVRTLPRIDATSKPGDSGGAVMHNGFLIGVLVGSLDGTHDGMFMPVEEVHEFLKECGLEEIR